MNRKTKQTKKPGNTDLEGGMQKKEKIGDK